MALQGTNRLTNAIINNYIKTKIEPIYVESPFLGMLKAKGRIAFNKTGKTIEWKPRLKRRSIRPIMGAITATQFTPTNTRTAASLGYVGYDMGEVIAKFEKLANKAGPTQIYDLMQGVLDEMLPDFMEGLKAKVFGDGNLTGYDLQGFESFMAYGALIDDGDGTDTWAAAPADTYAGLSTVLGAVVNNWTSGTGYAWPQGTGDPAHAYWSPLVVDYNSSLFNGTAHNWTYQWQQAMNALTTYLGRNQSQKVQAIVMDHDLLRKAKDSTINNQRFVVSDSLTGRKFGIPTLEWEGTEIIEDFYCPAGKAYAIGSWDKINLWSMQKDLIAREEDDDIVTSETLLKFDSYLQMWVESPAFFGALAPVSAAGT